MSRSIGDVILILIISQHSCGETVMHDWELITQERLANVADAKHGLMLGPLGLVAIALMPAGAKFHAVKKPWCMSGPHQLEPSCSLQGRLKLPGLPGSINISVCSMLMILRRLRSLGVMTAPSIFCQQ